jgi:hypothetical protein
MKEDNDTPKQLHKKSAAFGKSLMAAATRNAFDLS